MRNLPALPFVFRVKKRDPSPGSNKIYSDSLLGCAAFDSIFPDLGDFSGEGVVLKIFCTNVALYLRPQLSYK